MAKIIIKNRERCYYWRGFQRQNFEKRGKIEGDSEEKRRKYEDKILNKEGKILIY